MQTPTDYSGPYQTWNVDLNGDSVADAPWDFGTTAQYPVLEVDADGNGQATWQELGRQVRAGPTLTAVAPVGKTRVELSWTAADVSHWSPLPGVAYTVIRDDGAVTVLRESFADLSATDSDVTAGTTYAYQVAAVVEGGEPARSSLVEVTVVGNRAPTAVGVLADRTLPIADGAVSLDMSGAFEDLDGDALTYGASSSSTTVATASLSGSILTVNPLRAGTATIAVTATDVDGSNATATQRFAVTVVNLSPAAVGTIADRSVQVSDGVFMVDVSGAFQDPEGDALTYRAVSSDSSVASVTVSGFTVSVTPLSGGTATVTVTATDVDGSNTSATQTFDVTVASRPPEAVGTLAPLSLRVADGVRSVNVSGAFRDPDADPLTYSASSSDPSVATVSVTGATVRVTPVSGGTATVTVTATDADGSNTSATQTFDVTVENRSPVVAETLSPLSLRVADGVATVDVSSAFEDPDGDALTYGVSSAATAVATVSVTGATVRVTPLSGGTTVVTVTATDVDGSNTSATQQFEVTVANRSPEAVGSLSPLTRRVADGAATVDVSGAFRDPDLDALTYGASSSNASVSRAAATGSTVRVTPVSAGTAVVTVTATDMDGSNTSATRTFDVTVPENAGPEAVGSLEDKALDLQGGALTVDVSGAFRDPDRDTLAYGATSSDTTVATVSVSGSRVTLTPELQGTTTVTVTATERGGSNTSTTQSFRVTVAGNRSPDAAGALRDLSLRVADGAESVEVSGAFEDRDGDALTYGATSSDTTVATVSVSRSTVTVTPESGGTTTVTVTATDVAGSNTTATQSFDVTVANQSPEAVGQLAPLSLRVEDGPETMEVGFGFRDSEADVLTYGASSSETHPNGATGEQHRETNEELHRRRSSGGDDGVRGTRPSTSGH